MKKKTKFLLNYLKLFTHTLLFTFFFILNIKKILECKTIFFFRNKRYFVGNGFGHYTWTSFYLLALKIDEVFIVDFYNKFNQKIYTFFNFKSGKYTLHKKKYLQLDKKSNLLFYYFCENIFRLFNKKIINSTDDLYFFNDDQKKFFFNKYMTLKNIKKNTFYRAALSKYEMWNNFVFFENKNYELEKDINLDYLKWTNKRLNLSYSLGKNLVFYRRLRNFSKDYVKKKGQKDQKSGSMDIQYYEKIFNFLKDNKYNVFVVGDFTNDEISIIKEKYKFNIPERKNDYSDFYINAIANCDYFIGDSGGAADLAILLKKKVLLINFATIGEILPNTIIFPKKFIKDNDNKRIEMTINEAQRYNLTNNFDKLKLDCSLELVESEQLLPVIRNFLNNYNNLMVNHFPDPLTLDMEKYNCFFVKEWLNNQ